MSKKTATIKKICFIILAVLFGLFLCEILLRITPNIKVSTVKWVSHPVMGAIIAPLQTARFSNTEFDNVVTTNSAGYHDFEHSHKKNNATFRILILGDSFVEGLHVQKNELFFFILQQMLNKNAKKQYQIMSIARSGWGTAQQLTILKEQGFKYKPDLVILSLLPGNDFSDSHLPLKKDIYMPYYQVTDRELSFIPAQHHQELDRWYYSFYKKSQLLCFLRQNISFPKRSYRLPRHLQLYARKKSKVWLEAVNITSLCLKKMNELCVNNDIKFLCLVLDNKALLLGKNGEQYKKTYPQLSIEKYDFYYPYKFLSNFCNENNINYTAMLEYFQQDFENTQQPSHFALDGHWNKYGHNLAANFLYDYLCNNSQLLSK